MTLLPLPCLLSWPPPCFRAPSRGRPVFAAIAADTVAAAIIVASRVESKTSRLVALNSYIYR